MVDSETINKFIEVTGASAFQAIQYLEETDDFEAAVNDYYSSQLENEKGKGKSERPVNQTKASAGPKIRTFNDLNSNTNGDNNLFTGGEKSGLEVENPDKRGTLLGWSMIFWRKPRKLANNQIQGPVRKLQQDNLLELATNWAVRTVPLRLCLILLQELEELRKSADR